jgi:ABC-type lipoprotein export system ATPase subunit
MAETYTTEPLSSIPPKGSSNKATVSQQHLKQLAVATLKNLVDVEIDFTKSLVTALMGANCSGKTTVLHALACAFSPLTEDGPNYKFPQFFKPTSDSLWSGSDFTVHYGQRVGAMEYPDLQQRYGKASDRWTPRYDRRPKRYVKYVMIRDSVPEVETLNVNAMIHYTKTNQTGPISIEIRENAGKILNRKYDQLHTVNYQWGGRASMGVSLGSLTYPALSMSSGEQRVFRILEAIFSAPKYALILVDEIDLFLHQDALQRLLEITKEHCNSQKKQLIFTTHFPPVAKMYGDISVMSLHRTPDRTVVWDGYSLEALRHITGITEKPLSIYVEDDLAEALASQVASELKMRHTIQFIQYGAAANAFSVGSGLILSGSKMDNTLIMLDGDTIVRSSEKIANCKRVLSGTEDIRNAQRKLLRQKIRSFRPTNGESPEQTTHRLVSSLEVTGLATDEIELVSHAKSIVNVIEQHEFVDRIVQDCGEPRIVALSKLARLASKSGGWERYTRLLRFWLLKRREALNL